MKKTLGIIVTYNPDSDKVDLNIAAINSQVDLLVLLDNNSDNQLKIEKICNLHGITCFLENKNIGLGKAYNKILDKYLSDFDYFVTFDQDTLIPDKALLTLTKILSDNKDIGAVGPLFSRDRAAVSNNASLIFKHVIIQSCAVFRADLYNKTGGFNEEYFIDLTDFEYCLKVSGRPSTSCLSLIEFLALSQRKEYDKARRGTAFG